MKHALTLNTFSLFNHASARVPPCCSIWELQILLNRNPVEEARRGGALGGQERKGGKLSMISVREHNMGGQRKMYSRR